MSTPLAVGVIGVGALGRHHARHLSTLEGVRLVGVYDANPETAARVAAEVGAPVVAELDALLAQVRAVSIAVPTSVHAEVGLHALERGVAVLMEKPLAASLAEADALVAAADARGRPAAGRTDRAVQPGGARRAAHDREPPVSSRPSGSRPFSRAGPTCRWCST